MVWDGKWEVWGGKVVVWGCFGVFWGVSMEPENCLFSDGYWVPCGWWLISCKEWSTFVIPMLLYGVECQLLKKKANESRDKFLLPVTCKCKSRRHSRTVKTLKHPLSTCLKSGYKQVVHSYGLGISVKMRILKSYMDCADTVLAGNAFQSRIADGKKEPW